MIQAEVLLFWTAVAFYVGAGLLLTTSYVFNKLRLQRWSFGAALIGTTFHLVAVIVRWIAIGHGPYIYAYEIASSNSLVAMVFYLLIQWRLPKLRPIGIFVYPMVYLLIGYGVMKMGTMEPYPENFKTFWLVVHVFFAKIAYGSAVIAGAMGIAYLLKDKPSSQQWNFVQKLYDQAMLDQLIYKFIIFAFINIAIMIVAGSIWAYKAWGRYWGWDVLETWSLISWLIYGLYLHRRINGNWQGKLGAWYAIFALVALVFTFHGVTYVTDSLHSAYMK